MTRTRRARIKARTPEEFERWRKLVDEKRLQLDDSADRIRHCCDSSAAPPKIPLTVTRAASHERS